MTFKQTHRVWQPLAALMALMLLASPARASVQEMRVLATGVDRSSARAAELALDYAKKRAVYLVARKLQVPDAHVKLGKLKPEQWKEVVRGATVLQTRREGEITYADVSVTVVTEALRRVLDIEEPPMDAGGALNAARGVLVLGVQVMPDRVFMWEKENELSSVLRSELLRQGRGTVMSPAGDFDDRRLVDYQNVLEVTPEQLAPMFKRYGIEEIIIAVVTPGADDTLEPTEILLRRLDANPERQPRVEKITLAAQEEHKSVALRLARAAGAVAGAATQIAGATSEQERASLQDAPSLAVTFRYATTRELGRMQEAVRAAPGVLQLVMPAITLQRMAGVVYLSGKQEELRAHLVKQGIVVTDQDGGWLLSMR